MKNSTLFIRTILIIGVLTFIAHFFARLSSPPVPTKNESLLGYWEVEYTINKEKVKVIHLIEQREDQYIASRVAYADLDGNRESITPETVLKLNSITKHSAKGEYSLEYENQTYTLPCKLSFDQNQITLTYSILGQKESETWKKIKS